MEARTDTGWSYGKGPKDQHGDNSNTQYALLGLHAGLEAKAKIDPAVLQSIQDFYIRTQVKDGQTSSGWGYHVGQRPSMTMTSAGVCGLVITGMDLAKGQQVLRDDGTAQNCGVYKDNEPVAAGLEWIGDRFPARLSRDKMALGSPFFYLMYGIERTGRLTGQRYLGGQDWYRVGSAYLVNIQKHNGSWENPGNQLDGDPIIATSFSLLFLSKGRTPVLLTKFAHDDGNEWNRKRSDARHLVEFASKEMFKGQPMAWQAFDVRKTEAANAQSQRQLAAELLPSPLVYLTGHILRLSDKEKAILREYVKNGGFLFAEACCGDPQFDNDFRALMEELFPDSKLDKVPPEHPVWYASGKFVLSPKEIKDFYDKGDSDGLWGIQQGCKWVVMYSPRPLAGYWEENLRKTDRSKFAFQLGANVIAYATGLEPPRPRLTEVAIVNDAETQKPKRGYLEVGQLAHDGDWHPAPRAMRFLMEEVRKTGVDVLLNTAQVQFSDGISLERKATAPIRNISDVLFFYLHGRRSFTPGQTALKSLRYRLEGGATLLADACCGSKSFDEAFRKTMEEMWADQKLKLEPIPLTDELFSAELNGVADPRGPLPARGRGRPARHAGVQERAAGAGGDQVQRPLGGDLQPLRPGLRLEKHASSDCLGHDYASAAMLGKAAVLYALKR